jgi:hypothetical protein
VVPLGVDRTQSVYGCQRLAAGEDHGQIDDECMNGVLSGYLRCTDGVYIST